MGVVQPLVMRFLIDSILLEDSLLAGEKLILAIAASAIALLLIVASTGFSLIQTFEMLQINVHILALARKSAFGKMLKLPLSTLQTLRSSGAANRLVHDTQEMAGLLSNMVVLPIVLGIRVFATVLLLFWINWKLALFAILLIPPALGLSFLAIRKIQPLFAIMLEDRGTLLGRLTELFRGIRVLRIYSREEREKLNFARESNYLARIDLAATILQQILFQGWTMIIGLAAMVIICVGSVLSILGYASLGDIFALSLYTAFVLEPIFGLVNASTQSKRSLAALGRVSEVFDYPPDDASKGLDLPPPASIDEIELRSVSFGYDKKAPVLRNISFSAMRGETVALIGRSGSGKSTLIDLLSRFYRPDAGEIFVNGVDVLDINSEAYRRRIAIVEQEVTLFDGTVADNIAYAKPWASMHEIEAAASKAGAHEFISAMPDGYRSLLGENGKGLSGGERQRISIARAFLADPSILILDEATSSLDTESERSVQESLATLRRDRITFVIAHRLSTIRSADTIIVLQSGEIVEMGSHEQLMRLQGRYFDNVSQQSDLLQMAAVSPA